MGPGTELYYKPWVFFWISQSLGIILFIAGMAAKFSVYAKGRRESLYKKPDYLMMIKAFFRDVVFQRQLAERSTGRWLIHIAIFYGFLGLLLLSAIAVALETVIPADSALSQYMLHGQGHNYYKAAGDFFGLIIMTGLYLALIRRFIVGDKQLYSDASDVLALIALLILVTTGFLLEAARIALLPPDPVLKYSFIGYVLADMLRGIRGLSSIAGALWVFHALLNALLLAYIPHSKFLHIVNSPVEIVLNASEERMRGDLYL